MSHNQELPHDLLAERSLLGCFLIDTNAFDQIYDLKLRKEDFYHPQYRIIYDAIRELYESKSPIEVNTVVSKLLTLGKLSDVGEGDIREREFIKVLADDQISAANIVYYAKIVKEKAILRSLINNAREVIAEGLVYSGEANQFIQKVETSFFTLTQDIRGGGMKKLSNFLLQNLKEIESPIRTKGELSGLSTGLTDIDRKLLGLQPGQLVLIAARPGVGKTALAVNMGVHVAKKHHFPVAIFSLEMMSSELSMRIISSEARVSSRSIKTKDYSTTDIQKIGRSVEQLSQLPIFVNDNGYCTVLDIQSQCRKVKAEIGLGLVIVDYIQLMRSHTNNPSREQQISEISRGLKQLAKELECPIIALSQLNRAVESRHDKRPTIADLRESGSLEQDADVILLIYREDQQSSTTEDGHTPMSHNHNNNSSNQNSLEKGVAEIIIGKNRAGETGSVKLSWFGEYTTFGNLIQNAKDRPY